MSEARFRRCVAGCSFLFLPYLLFMNGCTNGPKSEPNPLDVWVCDACVGWDEITKSYNNFLFGQQDTCAPSSDWFTAIKRLEDACRCAAEDAWGNDAPSAWKAAIYPGKPDEHQPPNPETWPGKGLVEGGRVTSKGNCSWDAMVCALLGGRPSYASFEGPIDLGRSFVHIEILSENDELTVPVEGKVVMVGGNAPAGQQCDVELWYADFSQVDDPVKSKKGMSFSNMNLLNHGVWKGTKKPDTTLSFVADSMLSASGSVDGKHHLYVLKAVDFIAAKVYETTRLKSSGSSLDHALVIDAQFADEYIKITLHIHAWITDCRSKITVCKAGCVSIDSVVGKGSVQFTSDAKQLGNMSAQDLCNAVKADDYVPLSETGGTNEFPTFSYKEVKKPEPPTPWERSKQFKYEWRDRNGEIIGTEWTFYLDYMPNFPVTLTIENEWGKKISKTIPLPPTGKYCPYPKKIHLEAEQYDKALASVATDQCSEGGRFLGWINDGESVRFDNVNFGDGGMQTFLARISSATQGGTITVRLDKPEGEVVATCKIPTTGDWQTWKTIMSPLKHKVKGLRPVYLVFNGHKTDFLFNVNWIEFYPHSVLQMEKVQLIDHIDSDAIKEGITGPILQEKELKKK